MCIRDRQYTCHLCSKSFALLQYLREHVYTHTKEKPYVCGIGGCGKRYRQAGKLSLHRRTHKGYYLKQYDCKAVYALHCGMESPSSPQSNRRKLSLEDIEAGIFSTKEKILREYCKVEDQERTLKRKYSGQNIHTASAKEDVKESVEDSLTRLNSDHAIELANRITKVSNEGMELLEYLKNMESGLVGAAKLKLPPPFNFEFLARVNDNLSSS
eukprot:TRINITY_DN10705_c0_g4_i1.p1 TRINITY_DN10705_c0_g4~~TRINITY_DN10705_c0_g4_i1.p1  ORF type:complete len:213 (-),score=44.90 TRINITY_DN10705_c0_g4_i1:208-846(-)